MYRTENWRTRHCHVACGISRMSTKYETEGRSTKHNKQQTSVICDLENEMTFSNELIIDTMPGKVTAYCVVLVAVENRELSIQNFKVQKVTNRERRNAAERGTLSREVPKEQIPRYIYNQATKSEECQMPRFGTGHFRADELYACSLLGRSWFW